MLVRKLKDSLTRLSPDALDSSGSYEGYKMAEVRIEELTLKFNNAKKFEEIKKHEEARYRDELSNESVALQLIELGMRFYKFL